MYKNKGVKYSFAAHLRDTGTVSRFHSQVQVEFLAQSTPVWVYSTRAMDTTSRRRNSEDDRVPGRFYHRHWQGVPLNDITIHVKTRTMNLPPSLDRLVAVNFYV